MAERVATMYEVGVEVRARKRPDAFVIRLLKQRIRKSLGITPENRLASRETAGVGECRFGRGE